MRFKSLVLATALASAACASTPTPVTKVLQPAAVSTAASASPKAAASKVGTRLQAPKDGVVVAGHVVLDASYVVAAGAGQALEVGAAPVLAAGKGLKLTAGGQQLLGADGVAVAEADGNMISDNGGGIVSNNGGSIVANNGGGLVANNGGGLVVGKTRSYQLQADTPLAIGQQLPGVGMRIGLVSLKTGQRLPVGVDSAGQPVYAVYTNLKGGYTLYAPTGEAANVLVTAEVPNTSDARQQYSLISETGEGHDGALNEDSSLATREIREIFAGKFQDMITQDPAETACLLSNGSGLPDGTALVLDKIVEDFHANAKAAGINTSEAQAGALRALALRCADILLAPFDLTHQAIKDNGTSAEHAPNTIGRPALDVMQEIFDEAREAAAKKLAADPAYFDKQAYFQSANACDPGRYKIEKPSDFNGFLISEYLSNNSDPGLFEADKGLHDLGLPPTDKGLESYDADRLARAIQSIGLDVFLDYVADKHGEVEAVDAEVAAYDPTHPPAGGWPAPLRLPCPRAAGHNQFDVCKGPTPTPAP